MILNETDARAIDMLLGGIQGFPVEPAAAGAAGGSGLAGTSGTIADFTQSAGATGAVSDMTDDFSSRLSHVDDLLKLLDYLPAEEPPPSLFDRTLQRINESRQQSGITSHASQIDIPPLARPSAGFNPGINRSPGPADGDPATL